MTVAAPPQSQDQMERRDPHGARRIGRVAVAAAGPALIVAAVLIVHRQAVFGGRVIEADVLTFWLPQYCFLGTSLATGHIPGWNPFVMGGVPFAADPQSGWLSVPAMALFTALPCGVAITSMVALQPILAGLGVYGFLRAERVSPVGATAAGLSLALGIASTKLAMSLPFAGALAWTAVTLAACGWLFRARRWAARVVWIGVVAVAWGQLAGAHLSVGLLMGSAVVAVYVLAKAWSLGRADPQGFRHAAALVGMLVISLPLVNLAVLLPRVAYASETNLRLGYEGIEQLAARLAGRPAATVLGPGAGPAWPLGLGASPGPHLGAVILGLAFAGWWVREHRAVVAGFTSLAVILFGLSLDVVARFIQPALGSTWIGSFYVHGPEWLAYPILLIAAVLGGFGLDAWFRRRDGRTRILVALPGSMVLIAGPVLMGGSPSRYALLGAAALICGAILAIDGTRASGWAGPAIVLLLAVELTANGLRHGAPLPFEPAPTLLAGRTGPYVPVGPYLRPGPLVRSLEASDLRYVPIGRPRTTPGSVVPGVALDHATLFEIRNGAGFNPVQLLRYWSLVRASQPGASLTYSRSLFLAEPGAAVRDVLGVGWILSRGDRPPGTVPVAREGPWVAYLLDDPAPLASVVTSWRLLDGDDEAIRAIAGGAVDPRTEAVLERDPGFAPEQGAPGTVRSLVVGRQSVRAVAEAEGRALLVVRIPFERGWRAAIDGRPAPVLAADGAIQAVPLPPGRHVVTLRHDDAWIRAGLVGSGAAILILALLALALRRHERRSAGAEPTG